MNHENPPCRWHDQLAAYHDGELNSEAFQALENHLAGCRLCQQELAQLQAVQKLVSGFPQTELTARTRNQLQLRWRQQQTDQGSLRVAYSLLAVAASLLLCASIWLPWIDTHSAVASSVTTIDNSSSESEVSVGSRDDLVLTAWVGQDFSRSATHE